MCPPRRLMSLLFVMAAVAAACGGGGGGSDPEVDESGAADATDDGAPGDDGAVDVDAGDDDGDEGAVVSADGVLTVIPPEGSGEETVEAAAGIDELDGLGVSLRAYELGPDGSTFDDPVELRFRVTDEELAGGVLVAARSSDGTIEPLDFTVDATSDPAVVVAAIGHFTVDATSDPAVVVAAIGHFTVEATSDPAVVVATIGHFTVVELRHEFFSDITVQAPSRVEVDEGVPAGLQASLPAGFASDEFSLDARAVVSGEWTVGDHISGEAPDSLVCASVGSSPLSYSGLVIVDYSRVLIREPVETIGGRCRAR